MSTYIGSEILSREGGEFSLSKDLREIMCYMADGKLLVSKSHAFNPHVRGFMARLKLMDKPCEMEYVDLSIISELNESADHDGASRSASEMQRIAKDMFQRAVSMRASDIHIRLSKRDKTKILFRIHNDLRVIEEQPFDVGDQLCATIYQAMSDVSAPTFEPISRQDARIGNRNKLPAELDGIRIATSPQVDGYIMVLRLLYNDTMDTNDLEALGFSASQSSTVALVKRRPTGINIIGGPTGSGKSTTLQRILGSIISESQGRKHVITVEDPPEYPIPGAVQTPVTNADSEEERSRAFQKAIKASMRLDPDIIMIGEVRDTPSARLAVQAAMTGHQVWTTVHANSAFAIIDRFTDLGVPLELVSDPTIVTGLGCQRLLKVLCPHCKVALSSVMERYNELEIQRIMAELLPENVYVLGNGCPHCKQSGTIGRTVVAEFVASDERIMSFIRNRDRLGAIEYWRCEQMGSSMLEHAIEKINLGLVDPFLAEDIVGQLNTGTLMAGIEETRETLNSIMDGQHVII
jgi:type II secretory ATPase GspE/PulE/Tfp pilus assembly ATPase PilB-like protein